VKDGTLILVVEDDPPIRKFLRASLQTQGYRILEVDKGREALSQTASHVPDMIILDLGLPDMDGLTVIQELRQWFSAPIIVVSARGQERAKVEALDVGADDYLTKPFGVGELLARIRVAFRHSVAARNSDDAQTSELEIGSMRIDLSRRKVTIDGRKIHLTPTEYKLVALLAKNAGKVLTHKALLREVWGPGSLTETQYLRVFMANLRRKLEVDPAQPRYLMTEIGVGYRLVDE